MEHLWSLRLPRISWKYVERTLLVIGGATALTAILLTVYELRGNGVAHSADVMLRLDERLSRSPYDEMSATIDSGAPLLKANGGAFSESDVDGYLGLYETLYNLYSHGLLTDDMVYGNFSYGIERAYAHPEIQAYLNKLHETDDEIFGGFVWLGTWFSKTK